jgi:hypothetical protein
MGIFILERQLGISNTTLYLQYYQETNPWYEAQIGEGGTCYAFGSKLQMESCRRLVEDRLNQNGVVARRKEKARALEGEFTEVVTELRVAAAKARLPGKCSYV